MGCSARDRSLRAGFAGTSILLLAACASLGPPRPARDGEVIRYANRPSLFCIVCQQIRLTVAANRHAWIELTRRSAEGDGREVLRRPVLLAPGRLVAFRARLAPFRPRGTLDLRGQRGCRTVVSDGASLSVEWDDGRRVDRLLYDEGCDPDQRRAMREALEGAPPSLGIEGLTPIPGKRRRFR